LLRWLFKITGLCCASTSSPFSTPNAWLKSSVSRLAMKSRSARGENLLALIVDGDVVAATVVAAERRETADAHAAQRVVLQVIDGRVEQFG
jgi:hypothetical protein